jgi:hypothetical protein
MLFAAALAFAGIAGCAQSEADKTAKSESKVPHVTVDDLDKMLAAKEATPVDCNGDRTRKREGIVPGAIVISDEATFAATELPADKTAKLVFYCANPG